MVKRSPKSSGRVGVAPRAPRVVWVTLLCASLVGATGWGTGCSGWDPSEPFTRNAPDVNEALARLDAGELQSAEKLLEEYLGTGPCSEGNIGLPPAVRVKSNAGFDLGLTLFQLAERYGRRFGEEERGEEPGDPAQAEKRSLEIDCAQIIARAIANDRNVPLELRARAHYVSGNLEFLRGQYEDAVAHYDDALRITPGLYPEAGGDDIGRDAAHNRAIALRRLNEPDGGPDAEPDAEPDGGDDGGPDGSDDGGPDGGDDGGPDGGDDGGPDGGDDGGPDGGDDGGPDGGDDGGPDGGGPDGGEDGGADGGDDDGGADEPQPDGGDDKAQPPPSNDPEDSDEEPDDSQGERVLDDFDSAPTYQEQDAKRRARRGSRRRMEDK